MTNNTHSLSLSLSLAAYVLADFGYDVWLTNARGNTYSRTHTNLTPDDKEFWMFRYKYKRYNAVLDKVEIG